VHREDEAERRELAVDLEPRDRDVDRRLARAACLQAGLLGERPLDRAALR
jgi:hypothetical protein